MSKQAFRFVSLIYKQNKKYILLRLLKYVIIGLVIELAII